MGKPVDRASRNNRCTGTYLTTLVGGRYRGREGGCLDGAKTGNNGWNGKVGWFSRLAEDNPWMQLAN